jgi:hypothetical protein
MTLENAVSVFVQAGWHIAGDGYWYCPEHMPAKGTEGT